MLLSEIIEMYGPNAEVVSLITTEEIEYILSNTLSIKKYDFDSKTWDEIMSRSKKSIVNQLKEPFLRNLIGTELAKYVKEGPA